MSVGFICAGMSQALRRRWVVGRRGVRGGVPVQAVRHPALARRAGRRAGVARTGPGSWSPRRRSSPGRRALLRRRPGRHGAGHDGACTCAGVNLVKTPTVVGVLDILEKTEARDRPGRPHRRGRAAGRCGPGGGPAPTCWPRCRSSGCAWPAWPRGSSSRSRFSTTTSWPSGVVLLLLDFTRRRLAAVVGDVDRRHPFRAHPRCPARCPRR